MILLFSAFKIFRNWKQKIDASMVRLSPMINANYEDGDTGTYAFAEEAKQIDQLRLDAGTLKAHAIQAELSVADFVVLVL